MTELLILMGIGLLGYALIPDTPEDLENIDEAQQGAETDDILTGSAANDALSGNGGNDLLGGAAGDDVLYGKEGADSLLGGDGNDTIRGASGADSVSGGAGNDQAYLDSGSDIYNDLSASGGNDTVEGGSDSDYIFSGAGNDSLYGGSGNDVILDPAGRNTLSGGDAWDTLFGLDTIEGSADLLLGGQGNDWILGDDGDTLTGGTETDRFITVEQDFPQRAVTITDFNQTEGDKLWLSYDEDVAPPTYTLAAQTGGTLLTASNGVSVFIAGLAPDAISASNIVVSAIDPFFGRLPADLLESLSAASTEIGTAGNDLIEAADFTVEMFGRAGNDTLIGGAGNDSLHGEAGNDSLSGGAGDDILYATEGSDTLIGGAGNDTVQGLGTNLVATGGAGDDILVLRPLETAIATGGAGADHFSALRVDASVGESGVTMVTDYTAEDTLSIATRLGATGSTHPPVTFSETALGVTVSVSGEATMVLQGKTLAELAGTQIVQMSYLANGTALTPRTLTIA